MNEAVITNALLRCVRGDDRASSTFELVNQEIGLWVLELPNNIKEIVEYLLTQRPKLISLSSGSTDYTLHISAQITDARRLMIPTELSILSADCGFSIEVYTTQ